MKKKGTVSSFSFYLFTAAVQFSCFLGFFANLPGDITVYSLSAALPFAFIISGAFLFLIFSMFGNSGGDTSKSLKRKGSVFSAVYKLSLGSFFLLAAVLSVMRYTGFVSQCVNPQVSPLILIFLTFCGVLYGSCKGLEAICGANGIIFAVCVVFLSVLFLGLIPQLSIDEGTFVGFQQTEVFSFVNSLVYLLSGMFSLPLCVVLSEKTKGSRRSAFAGLGIYYLSVAIVFAFVIMCMGIASVHEINPMYVLSKLSGVSVIEENDGLFFVVRTALLFVELCGYTIGFSALFERTGSRKSSGIFCLAAFLVSEILYEVLRIPESAVPMDVIFVLLLVSLALAVLSKKRVGGGFAK